MAQVRDHREGSRVDLSIGSISVPRLLMLPWNSRAHQLDSGMLGQQLCPPPHLASVEGTDPCKLSLPVLFFFIAVIKKLRKTS